jgi:hypothetical protein
VLEVAAELGIVELSQRSAAEPHLAAVEAGPLGDGGSRQGVVAGDDDRVHAGVRERVHRLAGAAAERIVERGEADEPQTSESLRSSIPCLSRTATAIR